MVVFGENTRLSFMTSPPESYIQDSAFFLLMYSLPPFVLLKGIDKSIRVTILSG
jgi:hypothetical protein